MCHKHVSTANSIILFISTLQSLSIYINEHEASSGFCRSVRIFYFVASYPSMLNLLSIQLSETIIDDLMQCLKLIMKLLLVYP